MTRCTAITKLETLNEETDVLKVELDHEITAIMFYNYGEAMKYLDKEVIVTFRQEMYAGVVQQAINTLVEPVVVNTLDRTENIKLFVVQNDSYSNVSFRDIQLHDTKLNGIVYCVSQIYESSDRAYWCKFIIRDNSMRTSVLRLYDPEMEGINYAGKYIKADLRRNEYGFTTRFIKTMDNEFPENPEITIAYDFVLREFIDADVLNYITSTRILDILRTYVEYETGYLLVRLAIELSIVNELANATNSVDLELIKRALLISKSYVLRPDSKYSKEFLVCVNSANSVLTNKSDVTLLLDENSKELTAEKLIYSKVVDLADSIIRTKKEYL